MIFFHFSRAFWGPSWIWMGCYYNLLAPGKLGQASMHGQWGSQDLVLVFLQSSKLHLSLSCLLNQELEDIVIRRLGFDHLKVTIQSLHKCHGRAPNLMDRIYPSPLSMTFPNGLENGCCHMKRTEERKSNITLCPLKKHGTMYEMRLEIQSQKLILLAAASV